MHLSEIWEAQTLSARLLRGALWPASLLYAAGWECYASAYRLGIKRAAAPHSPVLCIGNLVSGGTGKSPMTVYVAQVLRDLGREVVISASGYGSPSAEAAQLAPSGPLKAGEWGDEPAMLRELLPEAPLIVGRRRVLAAEICHREFPGAVLLMDDGFQHLPLKKSTTIVLDPPRGNRFCLPAGPYREPRRNARLAELVIPGKFQVVEGEFSVCSSEGATELKGECAVLTALGNPSAFLDSLRANRHEIRDTRLLPDHNPLTAGNLFEGLPKGLPIVCTMKDWVKLRDRADIGEHEFWVARHRIRIEPEEEFRRWLAARVQ